MGLYIKDLDLPEGCGAITLKLWGDGEVEIFEEEEWRCAEAVSIPDHGGLIDRDSLPKNRMVFNGVKFINERFIKDAPVVIPADKERNG